MGTHCLRSGRSRLTTFRLFMVLGIAALVLSLGEPISGQRESAAQVAKPWPPPSLPDGQPNVEGGEWQSDTTPVFGGTGSLENPSRTNLSFQLPGAPVPQQPSRIIDPPDGRIPYLPWAAARKKQQEYDLEHPTRLEHLDTQHRCITGTPRLYYFVGFRIIQPPGFVVQVFGGYHQYRVIPVDGSPHIGPRTKLWGGDARGRWEGTTLHVDTTNLNGKNRLTSGGDFFSDSVHLVEKFEFLDAATMNYYVTIDDPKVFSRPWTMRVLLKRGEDDEIWENACTEGERPDQDDRLLGRGQYQRSN